MGKTRRKEKTFGGFDELDEFISDAVQARKNRDKKKRKTRENYKDEYLDYLDEELGNPTREKEET
tara:strand:- start:172 stop:366 length:195 start_codon:yes stop_codon:yes gene_type:complete